MGVEPTILAAKDRINGFEGHEDHRTLFASNFGKSIRVRGLLEVRNPARFDNRLRCYRGVGWSSDPGHGLVQIRDRQVCIPARHGETLVPEQFGDVAERCSSLPETRRVGVPVVVPFVIADFSRTHGGHEPMRRIIQGLTCHVPHNPAGSVASGMKRHERFHRVGIQWNMHGSHHSLFAGR